MSEITMDLREFLYLVSNGREGMTLGELSEKIKEFDRLENPQMYPTMMGGRRVTTNEKSEITVKDEPKQLELPKVAKMEVITSPEQAVEEFGEGSFQHQIAKACVGENPVDTPPPPPHGRFDALIKETPAPPPPPPAPAPAPTTNKPDPQTADAMGLKWDERIHSQVPTMTAKGVWRKRRGLEPGEFDRIKAEILGAPPEPPADAPPETITTEALITAAAKHQADMDKLNERAKELGHEQFTVLAASGDGVAKSIIYQEITNAGQ